MIYSIQFNSGYALQIKSLQQEINFTPDVNIICGCNGSGKSTLLKTIATYCFIKESGGIPQPQNVVADLHYRHNKAAIKWDSSLVAFFNSTSDRPADIFGITDNTSAIENELVLRYKASTGQERCWRVKRIKDVCKKNLDFMRSYKIAGNYSHDFADCYTEEQCQELLRYLDKARSEYKGLLGKPTIILDEPDRSLSVKNQIAFWELVVPDLAQEFQLLIATNSIFAYWYNKTPCNYLFLDKHNQEEMKEIIKKYCQLS